MQDPNQPADPLDDTDLDAGFASLEVDDDLFGLADLGQTGVPDNEET